MGEIVPQAPQVAEQEQPEAAPLNQENHPQEEEKAPPAPATPFEDLVNVEKELTAIRTRPNKEFRPKDPNLPRNRSYSDTLSAQAEAERTNTALNNKEASTSGTSSGDFNVGESGFTFDKSNFPCLNNRLFRFYSLEFPRKWPTVSERLRFWESKLHEGPVSPQNSRPSSPSYPSYGCCCCRTC